MGIYYNPGKEVRRIGRKLKNGTFDSLRRQLQKGELLFCLADVPLARTNPLRALFVETQRDYTDSRIGENGGYYKILGFYAVPRKQAEQGCCCKLP
ncbi:hypothetical protein KJ969_03890 [Patescibacteria group bacterium]|nr:hypothetical protein [Patescibacteria group bacterium]MBU1922077.1 hypothetical protein [Patescibacteria group bacterium]